VEVPPEEPTLTAQVDVRATLAKLDAEERAGADIPVLHDDADEHEEPTAPSDAEDRTVSGAVAVLVASEQPPSSRRPMNTLPFVAPSDLEDRLAPPSSRRVEPASPLATASRAASGDAVDDSPIEIPGVGASRRGMKTIVLSVLAACALVGIGALARHLWPESKGGPPPTSAAAAAPPSPSPTAALSAPPSAASATTAAPSAAAAITAAPGAASATAAPSETSVAAAPPSPRAAAAPASTAVAIPAPTAPRPAEPRLPATKRPAQPTKGGARGTIVRDAPF
jgi:hypothetical protein